MRLFERIRERLTERPCDFMPDSACVVPRRNILDRCPAPCGKGCQTADRTVEQASIDLIKERNKDAAGGRTNWEASLEHPDDYTVQTRAVADSHEGPVLVRIQNGEMV